MLGHIGACMRIRLICLIECIAEFKLPGHQDCVQMQFNCPRQKAKSWLQPTIQSEWWYSNPMRNF